MEFETHLENGLIHLPVSYQPVGCAEQSEAHQSRTMRFLSSPHPTHSAHLTVLMILEAA